MLTDLPSRWRWLIGAFVLLAAGIVVSAWIDNSVEGGDFWGVSLAQAATLWAAGFVAGFVVGRMNAAILALLPIWAAIPFGLQSDGGGWLGNPQPVAYYLGALAVFSVAFIAAGVGTARWSRRSEAVPG